MMKSNFHKYLLQTSKVKFIMAITFLGFVLKIGMSALLIFSTSNTNVLDNPISNTSFYQYLWEAVFLAPFLETFIFIVVLIILPLRYLLSNNSISYVGVGIFSAILFGLSHFYNCYYVIFAFGMGSFFSYVTITAVFLRENKINVWYVTFVPHMLMNLLAFLIDKV